MNHRTGGDQRRAPDPLDDDVLVHRLELADEQSRVLIAAGFSHGDEYPPGHGGRVERNGRDVSSRPTTTTAKMGCELPRHRLIVMILSSLTKRASCPFPGTMCL